MKTFRDWPIVVTLSCFVLVVIHFGVAAKLNWDWIYSPTSSVDQGVIGSIYLGVAAVAAINAGFAGVIIVFGLTPTSKLFRKFRQDSGPRMVSNWISVISSAFVASGISLLAAFVANLPQAMLSSALFEFACLLLVHSAIRSIWIMRILLDLVRVDDLSREEEEATEEDGDLFG